MRQGCAIVSKSPSLFKKNLWNRNDSRGFLVPVHCCFPLSEIQNVFDVVFHALRTLPFYLVSHMAVDIQCERRRGVAEVALHCLDAIAGADSCDGI